jgi:hypothetical protein
MNARVDSREKRYFQATLNRLSHMLKMDPTLPVVSVDV